MDDSTNDTSHELEELLVHYAKQWRRDVAEGLGALALDAVSMEPPSDRELVARLRALGVLATTSRRLVKLLRAHDQRVQQREREQPKLGDIKAGDLPVRDFWPGHPTRESSGPGV